MPIFGVLYFVRPFSHVLCMFHSSNRVFRGGFVSKFERLLRLFFYFVRSLTPLLFNELKCILGACILQGVKRCNNYCGFLVFTYFSIVLTFWWFFCGFFKYRLRQISKYRLIKMILCYG